MAQIPLYECFTGTAAPMTFRGEEKQTSYQRRYDYLFGTQCLLSGDRREGVRMPGTTATIDIRPDDECRFCNYETETPCDYELDPQRGRLHHSGGAVTVRNAFGYTRRDFVTILPPFHSNGQGNGRPHKVLLSELGFEDLETFLDTEHDMALVFERMRNRHAEIVGFRDFVNWGPAAGGSVQHPHLQRTATEDRLSIRVAYEMAAAKNYFIQTGKNPFVDYMNMTHDQDRVIYECNDVFIGTPIAPRYDGEVIVIAKQPVSHIFQTDAEMRRRIIKPTLGVFAASFYYCGRGNVNAGVHMTPFGTLQEMDAAAVSYYRWHMHIVPRKTLDASRGTVREAGSELLYDDYVIGEAPEDVATLMRRWFRPEGPDPEPVLPELRSKFDAEVLKK